MNTNYLSNTHKIKLNGNTTLEYGSPSENEGNIISITVKGKYTPIEKLNDYTKYTAIVLENIKNQINKYLPNITWFEPYYIFKIDMTEKGIKYNHKYKFKYQLYLRVEKYQNITEYQEKIVKLITEINNIIDNILQENKLSLSK